MHRESCSRTLRLIYTRARWLVGYFLFSRKVVTPTATTACREHNFHLENPNNFATQKDFFQRKASVSLDRFNQWNDGN